MLKVDEDNLAYTSDKDLLEQTFEKEGAKLLKNQTQGTLPTIRARKSALSATQANETAQVEDNERWQLH